MFFSDIMPFVITLIKSVLVTDDDVDDSITMKHYIKMNNSTYRLFESQVARMTLRSVSSDVEQIQLPEIHSSAIMQETPTLLHERLDQNTESTQCRTKRKSAIILGNLMKNILMLIINICYL